MKVLIVDSYNMIHRARYGFGDGDHSTTFNFFRQLKSEIDRHQPNIVYMVDEGRPLQSLAIDPNYKGNRKSDPDESFRRQKSEIFDISKTILGVRYAHHPDFECDDLVAHLAVKIHKNDFVTIVSSDSDFIQLLEESDKISLYNPIKKSFIDKFENYVVFKALKGDPTDNIPGIPGVGPSKATKLSKSKELMTQFFKNNPGSEEIYNKAYGMIKFKDVQDTEVCYIDSTFDEQELLREFTNREFKSIIGNAWPKWVKTFGGLNG